VNWLKDCLPCVVHLQVCVLSSKVTSASDIEKLPESARRKGHDMLLSKLDQKWFTKIIGNRVKDPALASEANAFAAREPQLQIAMNKLKGKAESKEYNVRSWSPA
jgi:hypothetical protein